MSRNQAFNLRRIRLSPHRTQSLGRIVIMNLPEKIMTQNPLLILLFLLAFALPQTSSAQQPSIQKTTSMKYYNMGIQKYKDHNYDGAQIDFDHAIALDPKLAPAYEYRALAKRHMGDFDGAIADYDI